MVWTSWRDRNDRTDDRTITSLKNSIAALETENELLKKERDQLKADMANLKLQNEENQKAIKRLEDLATNQTAINEVKAILTGFQAMQPQQQQLVAQFQKTDQDLLAGLHELRDMVREIRRSSGKKK